MPWIIRSWAIKSYGQHLKLFWHKTTMMMMTTIPQEDRETKLLLQCYTRNQAIKTVLYWQVNWWQPFFIQSHYQCISYTVVIKFTTTMYSDQPLTRHTDTYARHTDVVISWEFILCHRSYVTIAVRNNSKYYFTHGNKNVQILRIFYSPVRVICPFIKFHRVIYRSLISLNTENKTDHSSKSYLEWHKLKLY